MFLAVGEPFEFEILGRARWTPRPWLPTSFRDRRVFIAGDTAHICVPMGGFGMNAGITDAISLSWRLAGALSGMGRRWSCSTRTRPSGPRSGREVADQTVTWRRSGQRGSTRRTPRSNSPSSRLECGGTAINWMSTCARPMSSASSNAPVSSSVSVYADSPVICHDASTPPPSTSVTEYEETSWPGARLPHIWRRRARRSSTSSDGVHTAPRRTGAAVGRCDRGCGISDRRTLVVLAVDEPNTTVKYQGFGLVLVATNTSPGAR